MALEDYAKPVIFVGEEGGALVKLDQVTSVERITNGGSEPVETLYGLAGFGDAGGSVQIRIGYLIPKGGTEFPFQEACANQTLCAIQLGVGDKAYVGMGKFQNDTANFAKGDTSGTVEWLGEKKAQD